MSEVAEQDEDRSDQAGDSFDSDNVYDDDTLSFHEDDNSTNNKLKSSVPSQASSPNRANGNPKMNSLQHSTRSYASPMLSKA